MAVPPFTPISGESIYSILSRHFWLSGHYSYTEYLKSVFGSRKHRIHPYLPSGLAAISSSLKIPINKLLYEHTLFTIFALSLKDKESLDSAMADLAGNPVAAGLLPHYKLHFFNGHKYCPECVKRDVGNIGCGVWYINQQIPGVTACDSHDCELVGVSNQDYGLDRQLLLPTNKADIHQAGEAECKFARYSSEFLKLAPQCSHTDLIQLYRLMLLENKLISKAGSLRHTKIVKALNTYWTGLKFDSPLGLPSVLQSWGFIGPMLRNKTCYPTHIIKHVLLSGWLFDSNANLLAQKAQNSISQENRARLTALYTRSSINSKSSKTCSMTLQQVYDSMGLNVISMTQEKIVVQALHGLHRNEIAKNVGVSTGYVEQVISLVKGLSDCREHLRQARKLLKAIKELEKGRALHPNWLRKDFKSQHNQAYFYVYHHDRATLERILPPKTKPHRPCYDWLAEDIRLYTAIKMLSKANGMSLSAIGRSINDRGHLRKKMHELPQTRLLLIKLKVIKSDG